MGRTNNFARLWPATGERSEQMPSNEDLIEWEISRGYGPERVESAMPGYLAEQRAEALAEAAAEVERLFHLADWEYTEAEGDAAFVALREALARYQGEKPSSIRTLVEGRDE